jgi:hypothetical protein
MIFTVPELEATPWPTLGPQVCAWVERWLVHGPGDLRGQPARLDAEKRALIYRAYEVWPEGSKDGRGALIEGRRRFRRVGISLRKGVAKTELAAWIAAAELHPQAPVRCGGFRKGQPLGVGLGDVYIPLIASTEEQSDDLCYSTLRVILSLSPLAEDFDIGLQRIMRRDGTGKAQALAGAPDARDGALTTFQVFDESHRLTLPSAREAHRTMLANLPKRRGADPWALEITTAYLPGEQSVAEGTMEYARAVKEGRMSDPKLFFFHREAGPEHDLTTPEGLRAAVLDASGPAAEWSDVDGICAQWQDPSADPSLLARLWLNQIVHAEARAFDVLRWKALAKPEHVVPDGAMVALGFDGSRRRDATALVGTEIVTGHQFLIGCWEKPATSDDSWEVPVERVEEAVANAFARWDVWRLYADPPYWESQVSAWSGIYGEERVVAWWTNKWRMAALMVRAYANAITHGELSHDGSEVMTRHIGNSHKWTLHMRSDDGAPLFLLNKERKDSPNKIDAAMAGALSWRARCDAITEGVGVDAGPSIYDQRLAAGQEVLSCI